LINGSLSEVQEHFKVPSDMLKWEVDGVDGMSVPMLEYAFQSMNLDILKHLFEVSPLHFMQQLTMQTTGYQSTAVITSAMLRATEDNIPKLCECLQWMCDTGIMTDDVFKTAGWTPASHTPANLKDACDPKWLQLSDVLEKWLCVPQKLRTDRTRECFIDLLPPPPPVLTIIRPEAGAYGVEKADVELKVLSMPGDTVAVVSAAANTRNLQAIRDQIKSQTAYGTHFTLVSSSGHPLDSDSSLVHVW